MSNQTIDGVPRELLTQWLAMFEGGIASSPLSALRELTRKYLQTEPADQAQGVPVAWMFKYLSHSDSPPYRTFEVTDFHQNPKAPGIAQHTPLYAEQPKGEPSEVVAFGIQVEKLLCKAIGREWSASGISIESLVAELKVKSQGEPVAKNKPVAKLHAERLTGRDGEYGVTVEDSQWFNTCRLTGGIFNLYAEPPAPVAVELPEREMYCQYQRGVIPDNRLEVEAHKDGWNACLDELKRLNPSL